MLSKQQQLRFLESQLAGIISFLTEPRAAKPGKKEIHDLRINIKKIMALVEVNKIRGYDAGTLALHGMKSLFRTAGIIRNSQVIISNILQLEADGKKVIRYHRDIIRQTSKQLLLDLPLHLKMVNDFRVEMRSRKLNTISNDLILLYHELKSDYLKKIFKEPLDPGTLHEGRKQIKHILYLREMIKPSTAKMIPLHYDHLDELQSMIGKWHDSVVLLDFVREFNMGKKSKGLKVLVQKKKDEFDAIRAFRKNKKNEIFIP
jgi:CHAD domain-containing protein